ncbi:hypothetical protein BLS_001534 [Venturia inaequalis]|nr:hypothetical protein BLS_001534 [Venturia inaequalis]KAE9978592.1 hypothetical protein EG328_001413 [Venturia inaequalis]
MFSAASQIPHAWAGFVGDSHLYPQRLHAQYGEIVRIAPNELSFITEQAWKDIHMHRQDANGKAVKQLAKHGSIVHGDGVYSILDAPDDVHARQRKMLSHAFSDRASCAKRRSLKLRAQEPVLQSYADLVMRNLRDDARCNRPVDIVETFNFFSFDIIAFGESFKACETREEHPWFAQFANTIKFGSILAMASPLPFAPILMLPFVPFVMKRAKFVFDFTKEKVKSRIAQGDKEKLDFMALVLKHNTDDGNGITIPEIISTFEALSIAGSETTATLMSGLMWYLHTNPSVLQKLRKELRTTFDSDSSINLLKVDQLPYFQAVVQEALRMYSPIGIAVPRRTPPSGISISGEWIPGNTTVGMPHLAASWSPTNFAEPTKFAPERHLRNGERPEIYEGDKRGAMQPFSLGPRGCLGKNLANAEIKLIISRMIYNFDFEVVGGREREDWAVQKVWGLYDKKPLMLWVKERKEEN